MPEEHETIESRSSASQEVYQQTNFMAWFEKAFPWLLVSGATLGLTLMIILPIIFFQEKTGDQLKAQSDLRLALLYTTGGTIAALGLLETYRKNTNDRTKANADINATLKNQDHQTRVLKEQIRQFDKNAFKERKAETPSHARAGATHMGHTAPWNLDVTAESGGRESLGRLVIILSKCCTLHFYCGGFLPPFTELFIKRPQHV